MLRSLYIDYEFGLITHPMVGLVCAATYDPVKDDKRKWWLHNDPTARGELREYLATFDHLIAYSVIAEARSFLAMGLEPLSFKWTDLFVEYRMLTNHNDRLQWGKQLVDGRVKNVRKPKPKWERTEQDKATGFRATHSLAEATYKLTGQIRDTEHKTKMRDLIISYPETFSKEDRKAIMSYCLEDVVFLPEIRARLEQEFLALKDPHDVMSEPDRKDILGEYRREARLRGRYAAHTAHMENRGYPIDVEATRNFSRQVGCILFDMQREINGLFPEIAPFKFERSKGRFRWDQKITKDWIRKNHDVGKWDKTDGGDISLALDAFTKFYDFKHSYPENNFGAQIVRLLKLKQSLYGFAPRGPDSDKKIFWDYVGPDNRVRPYMNIFGAQSSRSQPAASGFMFLKPAWMRALVQPAKGKYLASIDYASQEFFLAALRARDENMIQAYLSGDVYLAFGKLSKQIPAKGTKATHPIERFQCKSTVLGISYLMTKYGLAIKLTNDSGRVWTEDEAQEQIDMFYDAFPELKEAQEELQYGYGDDISHIKLPCGWYMWGDNPNIRSVVNVPIQGSGASIMRRAVDLNYARGGAPIAFTLHDALYIEGHVGDEERILILRDAMRDAFAEIFPDQPIANEIKLDPFIWGPSYKRDSSIYLGEDKWEVPASDLYIDERSIADFQKFSKYFQRRIEDEI